MTDERMTADELAIYTESVRAMNDESSPEYVAAHGEDPAGDDAPRPAMSDRYTDDELAELLTEILYSITPERDADETRRKVADVIARRAEIESIDDDVPDADTVEAVGLDATLRTKTTPGPWTWDDVNAARQDTR